MSFHLDSNEYSDFKISYRHTQIAEINMTPFVDVCLVLLIIFMVTAPFAISGVNVKLPSSQTKMLSLSNESLVLSISKNGQFYLGKKSVSEDNLIRSLVAAKKQDPKLSKKPAIFIRADKGVRYAKVMTAMSAAHRAGILKIGMLGDGRK